MNKRNLKLLPLLLSALLVITALSGCLAIPAAPAESKAETGSSAEDKTEPVSEEPEAAPEEAISEEEDAPEEEAAPEEASSADEETSSDDAADPGEEVTSDDAEISTVTITVKVNHLDTETYENSEFTIETSQEFLRGAMEEVEGLIEGIDSEYGIWITAVDGETADDSLEQWWGFDVNGEMGMLGADTQPVADGDVFEFTLNEGYDF